MEKAKFISLSYENSDTIEHQGNRSSIAKYLNKGYYIVRERNGYYVLAKSPRVNVTIEMEDGRRQTIDMKYDIREYYQSLKISRSLANRFAKACEKGKVKFYLEKGNICFQ